VGVVRSEPEVQALPARVIHESDRMRQLFRERIRQKVGREKERMRQRIDDEAPWWISWAVKPLAAYMFDRERARDAAVGRAGERRASLSFWLLLPPSWVVIHDAVLEPEPEEFIQIDHLLVGPSGVCLVETKSWEGAFLCRGDRWLRKDGGRWVPCKSPTAQSLRHARLFRRWVATTLADRVPAGEWVRPVILLTGTSWLRVEGSSVPVFESGAALAWHLRGQTRDAILTPAQVNMVAEAVANAGPCDHRA